MKRSYKRLHLGVRAFLILSIVALAGSSLINVKPANAATTLPQLEDHLSRMQVSQSSSHEIFFGGTGTPGFGVGEDFTIDVTDFTMGVFNVSNIDFSYAGIGGDPSDCGNTNPSAIPHNTYSIFETLGTSASGATWGVTNTAGVIKFQSGTRFFGANTCYRIRLGANATNNLSPVNFLTNPSTPSSTTPVYVPVTSTTWAGGAGITGKAAMNIISPSDQVTVTATVNPAIACSLPDTSTSFGELGVGAPTYAIPTGPPGSSTDAVAYSMTNYTNGVNGMRVTVNGATLTSGANTITAIGSTAANVTSGIGTEQFGMRVEGGSLTPVAPYDGATPLFAFVPDADFTTSQLVAKATAPVATNTLNFHLAANVAASTEPGTYTTTLTNVCTGYF